MARKPFDFYETPDWAVWALLQHWQPPVRLFEPCLGGGAIRAAVDNYWDPTWREPQWITNDIDPTRRADYFLDMRSADHWRLVNGMIDGVITNPPYGRAAPLILEHALNFSNVAVAMFLRNTFTEPCENRSFLRQYPESLIISLPRYSFREDKDGTDSSACSWFVWDKRLKDQRLIRMFPDQISGFYKAPRFDPRFAVAG